MYTTQVMYHLSSAVDSLHLSSLACFEIIYQDQHYLSYAQNIKSDTQKSILGPPPFFDIFYIYFNANLLKPNLSSCITYYKYKTGFGLAGEGVPSLTPVLQSDSNTKNV